IISDEQLKLPQVAGLTIRARWAWLHPGDGQFDLAFLDTHVERCRRLGKRYKILIMTGANCSPEWIGGAWHRGAPVPWSPELAKHYGALVAELGKKYGGDPLLAGVHITGPTFPSAEMHPAPGIESVAGYSDAAMIAAWSAAIDAYAAAFPETACILSISVRPPAVRYLAQVVEYGNAKLGKRFTLEHNALKSSTHPNAPHHVFIASQAKLGVRVGFEMVCAAANAPGRFGSREVMDGIARGKAAGGVYFDVYPPDLKSLR
nr:beta-galactosidase [Pirellulales bacterium]